MRKKIVAGNWKMNLDKLSSKNLVLEILEKIENKDTNIIISPPFIYLEDTVKVCLRRDNLFIAAQNCSSYDNGAYTGEVSAKMLSTIGVDYVILGHSERRQYFNESNEVLNDKLTQAISNNLKIIFCCGEDLEQRENNEYFDVIKDQLNSTIFLLSKENFRNIVIAYEPIWAIGTGKTASSDQAQEMHFYIRSLIKDKYGDKVSNETTILYGGSCKPSNSLEIFSQNDIDGGLIGGASLNSTDFVSIIESL
tara:strand:- start:3622 stop:4374 length:753 start_codon:yes stop_codon:yes gene_type:complete